MQILIFLQAVDLAETRAAAFIRVAAATLPLFKNEMRWARAKIASRIQSRRKVNWHRWQRTELGMQCVNCLIVSDSERRPQDGCQGTPNYIKKLLEDPKGHSLVAMSGQALCRVRGARDGPVGTEGATEVREQQFLCLKCGGWSQGKMLKLGKICLKPTKAGAEVLRNFRRGLGPNPRMREIIDKALPVSRIDATLASARDTASVSSAPEVFVVTLRPPRMSRGWPPL